jgi:hypothetical protein
VAWWPGKLRQTLRYFTGSISPRERDELAGWLTPAQRELFDSMHPFDQRHGLDVVRSLRAAEQHDPELLLAGLFHDGGKGRATRFHHRVAWSLGEHYGPWVWAVAGLVPGMRPGLERMRTHAERSAQLALTAGCSALTAEVLRGRAVPASLNEALRLADEAN